MHIVFDAYWWVSGPASNRHVLRDTVLGWLDTFPDDEVTLVVRRRDVGTVRDDLPARVTLRTTRWWPHALGASVTCGRVATSVQADVVFVQNFASRTRAALSVVFLHDVLFLSNPEWFTLPERAYFRPMRWLARFADLVLTSSQTEAIRIRSLTPARRVEAVGIGMSEDLIGAIPTPPPLDLRPQGFLLTVGRLNVRKNLATTIAAALRSGMLSRRRPLVIVGSADGKPEDLPPGAAEALSDGRLILAGHVRDAELVWLYQNTSLFLFLSKGEGFGMPVVEAEYFGAPMVLSDIAVFTEIGPETARRVSPDDVADIADAIVDELASTADRSTGGGPVPRWTDTVSRMRAAVVASSQSQPRLPTP